MRYAIQGVADCRRIEMPEGCAVSGARRRAVEHSMETGQVVWVLHRSAEGEEWQQMDRVDVLSARTPTPKPLPRAADLPEGSVVAGDYTAWIKVLPSTGDADTRRNWSGSNRDDFADWYVDHRLAEGARVLRVGTGQEG